MMLISILSLISCTPGVSPDDTTTPDSPSTVPSNPEDTDKDEEANPPKNDNIVEIGNLDVEHQELNERVVLKYSETDLSKTKVSYKKSTETSYKDVDKELITLTGNAATVELIGLSSLYTYDIKIKNSQNKEKTLSNIKVYELDRSGYAHFNNTTGIGAYNNDGTLKSNAVVVYVSNETKNTVKATIGGKEYTGLVNILKAQSKSKVPLDIRILDSIKTNQWSEKSNEPRLADKTNLQSDTFWVNTFETKYGDNLEGLTVKYMDKVTGKSTTYITTASGLGDKSTGSTSSKTTTYKGSEYKDLVGKTVYDDDSYWNMLDVSGVSNVTLEGVGDSAEFFQFGLTWADCNSIEVKNITFTDYPEDACSFESSKVTDYGNYWIHNNTFNRGKNNWDVSGERDKYAGDGGMDLKIVHNVTASYNHFVKCKKTGLIGGSDSNLTMNITFHHNYYEEVESRLPLGRQANMHIYNNYYYKCGTAQDIRANAFVLSEANYFEGTKDAHVIKNNAAIIKSYNDVFNNSKNSAATKVSSRTETISGGSCKPDGTTDYNNFDINSKLFYYDSVNKKSDVSLLETAENAKETAKTYAGAGKKVELILK